MTSEADSAFASVSHADVTQLGVTYRGRRVGTLARTFDGLTAFEYDPSWIANGFSISPLSLPLRSGVFIPSSDPFDGLFGVFQDSLPDGWGALLLARMLRKEGIDPESVSPMTLLSIVGSGGRGGLCYEPEIVLQGSSAVDDLDRLSSICADILADRPVDDLDEAYKAGGSSAGARPKAYIERGGTQWLVKFPSSMDPAGIGSMEYAYSLAAQDCGLHMPRTQLMPSRTCDGYFATERFDRDADGIGVHMITASGLLEVSHRFPVLDYKNLFQATQVLTRDLEQTKELYRLMCFNVFAHNQDDYSNNFAWLYEEGIWKLSPAYDLTYSTSFGDEHATMVNGRGKPGLEDVVSLGVEAGVPIKDTREMAKGIERRCKELLSSLGLDSR